ncbi:glutamate synthase [Eubacterium sp.]|uniref:GltB/FmdC/FwdC-like GXGXG domain-containing protein n=1 Tax=Eubacterium sp. TaxID=142586 RepID=UPI002FC6BC8F
MIIEANEKYYTQLNHEIKCTEDQNVTIKGVLGQRYIGTGVKGKDLTVFGTPGNAMGAYLNQTNITVYGNVQDAVGDTMDSGDIVVYGKAGDTLGYGMRGGSIYIRDDGGYRVGIHMKAYEEKQPVIVIGGRAGSFLGEYQAGGTILVLGIGCDGAFPAGGYCGTGMHGGAMVLRCDAPPVGLPEQVTARPCSAGDMEGITPYIQKYCHYFDGDLASILGGTYYKLTPSAGNPYHGLYTPY